MNYFLQDGFTALSVAVTGGKVDCVAILLSHMNIDINIKDKVSFSPFSTVRWRYLTFGVEWIYGIVSSSHGWKN